MPAFMETLLHPRSPATIVAFGAALVILMLIIRAIYALYLHPLAKFPGPKHAAVFDTWYLKNWPSGHYVHNVAALHKKYGPVVRTGPNDLSFSTPQSLNDIYGHAKKDHSPFLKSLFYEQNEPHPGLVTMRDPQLHRETRRMLAHGFSAKALRDQSTIVNRYIQLFLDQAAKVGDNGRIALDVTDWFNWFTFDVIGDLTFGESFHALENAKTVPWIETILGALFFLNSVDLFRRMPWAKPFQTLVLGKEGFRKLKIHMQNTKDKVKARREKGNDRGDFFSQLLSEKRINVSNEFLVAQSHTLVVAGSETTATALASTTYQLVKNPEKLKLLVDEIRSNYSSASEIDIVTTQHLPYLNAVIEEGLRIFPPVAGGGPRLSPGATVDGYYVPEGSTVVTSTWSISQSEELFYEPKNFHPERWLPKDHEKYDPRFENDQIHGFKAFGIGPRNCLGMNLAYMEMQLLLSNVVWHYDLEAQEPFPDWSKEAEIYVFWKKPKTFVKFKPVLRES